MTGGKQEQQSSGDKTARNSHDAWILAERRAEIKPEFNFLRQFLQKILILLLISASKVI